MSRKGLVKKRVWVEATEKREGHFTTVYVRNDDNLPLGEAGLSSSEDFPEYNTDEDILEEIHYSFIDGIPDNALGKSISFEEASKDYDDFLKERNDTLNSLIEEGDPVKVLEFAADTAHSPFFQGIAQGVNTSKELYDTHAEKFSSLSKALNKAIEDNKEFDASDIYPEGQKALYNFEEYKLLRQYSEGIQNSIAKAIGYSYQNRDHSGVITELGEDTPIGNMENIGEFPVGSREWLEARQDYMGGSDIGTLCGDKKDTYYNKNLDEIWESKVLGIEESQVEEQLSSNSLDNIDSAIARGNAMEEYVGELYAVDNPDVQVLHSKASWRNPGSNVQINFDMLLSKEKNGIPDGSLEIKTSTKPQDWGNPEDGIDGIPLNYRAQALSQCLEAGFSHGAVAVIINGSEYRSYPFTMTDELRNEALKNKEEANKFIEAARAARNKEDKTRTYGLRSYSRGGSGLNSYPNSVFKTTPTSPSSRKSIISKIAKLHGITTKEADAIFLKNMPSDKSQWNRETITNGLDKAFIGDGFKGKTYLGIDLETNGISATRSNIIEYGSVSMNMDTGKEEGGLSTLHDVSDKSYMLNGVGETSVHGIKREDIVGKPRFNDPEVQKNILEEMKKHRIVGAHNASFEAGYLNAHLEGFAEARAEGSIVLFDTMDVTRYTERELDNKKLQGFVEANGLEYKDAHRAQNDARMMMEALVNWKNKRVNN